MSELVVYYCDHCGIQIFDGKRVTVGVYTGNNPGTNYDLHPACHETWRAKITSFFQEVRK